MGERPNREELLRMGITTAKNGNKEAARRMFEQVLGEDAKNERAMIWMARLSDSRHERKKWLNRVLEVNPDNAQAQQALARIDYRRSAKENRTLVLFGVLTGVLVVLAIAIVIIVVVLK
jgi:Tfp pilus assembly protein PilF